MDLTRAHTLGIGNYRNFQERLGTVVDPTLSTIFSLALQTICTANLIHRMYDDTAGAHTLGIGNYRNFQERLGTVVDPTLSTIFSLALQTICTANLIHRMYDDTALIFDNQYFIDIQNGRGLLKIDPKIARDPRTMPHVIRFGNDMQRFFNKFFSGFLKLSSHKVLGGEEGEIRRDCRYKNN
ncbi:peroxidase 29-like [Quercus robur]|uniref:peroxidase 29-like n=1 Tax=Quercus robur TaxID=38942 RepID=UPI00216361D2|nr:peroxidase 29-like [Quercus robur]